MIALRRAGVALIAASSLAACQGGFSSGTSIPNTIPQGNTVPQGQATAASSPKASPAASNAPASASMDFAQASEGFVCPKTVEGYSCVLRFNVVATPSPAPTRNAKGGKLPTPSPTPSPTPTPSPSPSPAASGSPGASPEASPSASPSTGTVSLVVAVMPLLAPKLVYTGTKPAVPTTALMQLLLIPSADFALNGPAIATFTLPQEQIGNRGFAVQIFEEVIRKKKVTQTPIVTLSKSELSKNTLTFAFTPPKITLPKNHHFLIVLYGDDRTETAAPASSGSPSSSPAASPTPTP